MRMNKSGTAEGLPFRLLLYGQAEETKGLFACSQNLPLRKGMEHMKENTPENKCPAVACDTVRKPVSSKEAAA